MRRTIVGLFPYMGEAYNAIKRINEKELANNQISIVTLAKPNYTEEFSVELKADVNHPLSSFDGILVQGDIIDSSVGEVAAAGPFAGALGQGDKSIADCLQYYGVARDHAEELMSSVGNGEILTVIETKSIKSREVANILKGCGGKEVKIWSKTIDKPLEPPK
jgi:hypothetical protein